MVVFPLIGLFLVGRFTIWRFVSNREQSRRRRNGRLKVNEKKKHKQRTNETEQPSAIDCSKNRYQNSQAKNCQLAFVLCRCFWARVNSVKTISMFALWNSPRKHWNLLSCSKWTLDPGIPISVGSMIRFCFILFFSRSIRLSPSLSFPLYSSISKQRNCRNGDDSVSQIENSHWKSIWIEFSKFILVPRREEQNAVAHWNSAKANDLQINTTPANYQAEYSKNSINLIVCSKKYADGLSVNASESLMNSLGIFSLGNVAETPQWRGILENDLHQPCWLILWPPLLM